ncbi:MAG: hypothetical protein ACPLZH_02155, partial [Minisyncoccales bacterium]
EKNNLFYLFLSGLSLGASFSVKWAGGTFFILALLLLFFKNKKVIREKIKSLFFLFFSFLIVYLFSFQIHFQLIPNKSENKIAYEQAAFVGDDFEKLNFFQKLWYLNKAMLESQKTLRNTLHPYQSDPYFWPLMKKEIFYWVEGEKKIFLIGNPFIWYSATFSFFILILSFIFVKLKKFFQYSDFFGFFIFFAFFINYLPFFFIQRPLFLYHYLPAYSFLIAHLSFLLEKIKEKDKILFFFFLLLSFLFFFKNFALSYGL